MLDSLGLTAPVVAVTRQELPGEGLDRLARYVRLVRWQSARFPDADQLARLVSAADGLLCLGADRIDREFLAACPRLRVVATASAGFDNLDLMALTERRILASNTPGVLTETTADLTWALILAVCRRVVEADRLVRDGLWRQLSFDLMLGRDVYGATLGIVGYGAIGRAVARRAVGFGMDVFHSGGRPQVDDFSRSVPLDELLRIADIVTLHVPLTLATRHLIAERELELMKPTAVLINVARGGVVDQAALYRALREKWIFAAGLDVTAMEPIPADDPILSLANCIVLPHIGSATEATRARMVDDAVDNLIAGLAGELPRNCLNPAVFG